jgi:hypothetical protein
MKFKFTASDESAKFSKPITLFTYDCVTEIAQTVETSLLKDTFEFQ